MEELKRTKRITIGVFAFIAVIIIGLVTLKKPKNMYELTPQQMNKKLIAVSQVTPDEVANLLNDTINTVFVDVRSIYDFEKGSIGNAINIPIPMLLENDNKKLFDQWKKDSVTVVFYGNDQLQANAPWMLMYQLGYTNTKVLLGGKNYLDKQMGSLLTDNLTFEMENPMVDYKAILAERGNGSETVTTVTPKKKVVVRKKKKKAAEGGC